MKIKDKWWVVALILIFIFSYFIRSININPDINRVLSFDPTFQYRYTKYFTDWGIIPLWDELTYYPGRLASLNSNPPLMYYTTSLFYWLLTGFGLSLLTTASYMSAIYGALIVIPAFLLGRELSNKYGGLMAAVLVGSAPQILIRTFGSSFDTDQLVVFFILLTLYLGIYALRKRTVFSLSIALIGFISFMITWQMFWYTFFILLFSVFITILIRYLKDNKTLFNEIKKGTGIMLPLLVGILLISFIINSNVIDGLIGILTFAQSPEIWIVNISIAELQPIDFMSINTWMQAMGNFISGNANIDMAIFIIFLSMIGLGLLKTFKENKIGIIISFLIVGIYTLSRGVRFTEFSSILFLIPISVGFGYLVKSSKNNNFKVTLAIGLCIMIGFIGVNAGSLLGNTLGPDADPDWDNTWKFLKEETDKTSLVGTWWDPGHMVTGLAERRVMADGAHCGTQCLYTINDRITDLGKMLILDDEEKVINIMKKYKGTSDKIYWIASEDLILKFQWPQYFGIGCDARVNPECQLYYMLPKTDLLESEDKKVIVEKFADNIFIININDGSTFPIYTENGLGAILEEGIFYTDEKNVIPIKYSDTDIININATIGPILEQLNIKLTNQILPLSLWVHKYRGYVVLIPPNLRNSMFTKQFFLEGQGLENFKQVFRNEKVKIYEVDV